MGKGSSSNIEDLAFGDASPRSAPPPQYLDLDTLRNADGLVSIISMRRANGAITFGIFKEFDRDGRTERTSFIAETLRASYLSLAQLTMERIDEFKANPDLVKDLQRQAGFQTIPDQRRRRR